MSDDCTLIGQPQTGSFAPAGLRVAGRITEVTLSTGSWSALPTAPLSGRNAISIQNISAVEIKLQYDNTVSGYVGVVIPTGVERQYDITDNIIVYAKASAGAPIIVVEEIS